jgi:chromosome segregation ATPase
LSEDDFYTPTDIDALRMENELLVFEARFLKTKLAARATEELEQFKDRLEESERRLEESERRLEESERRLEESERRLEESERSATQLRARAERAEQDIILLLGRLANSPFGWFFGTKQNFRVLEQRYLGGDD